MSIACEIKTFRLPLQPQNTGIAQLVEHRSPKPSVGSSSLSSRAKIVRYESMICIGLFGLGRNNNSPSLFCPLLRLRYLCIALVRISFRQELRLKGNRVQIPDSPAAVSFAIIVAGNNLMPLKPNEGFGKASATETSQKTCHAILYVHCFRGKSGEFNEYGRCRPSHFIHLN